MVRSEIGGCLLPTPNTLISLSQPANTSHCPSGLNATAVAAMFSFLGLATTLSLFIPHSKIVPSTLADATVCPLGDTAMGVTAEACLLNEYCSLPLSRLHTRIVSPLSPKTTH